MRTVWVMVLGSATVGGCEEPGATATVDGAAASAKVASAEASARASAAASAAARAEVAEHVQVSGRLPPEVVTRIVKQNRGRFQTCFEEAYPEEKPSDVAIMVLFTIGEDGAVKVARAVGGGASEEVVGLRGCSAEAMKGLSFPQPPGGVVRVTFPLAFAADGTPAALE